ncbi:MAG: hypothetical protein ABW185_00470 [Sedimenticola sp.]
MPDLDEMRETITEEIQMDHKEEAPARIKADRQDRLVLRQKLAICINPLHHNQHPPSQLINIATGEVILNQDVNVDNALELGKKQQDEFEAGWPDAFYKPLKRISIPMTANRKSIDVGGQKIVDTGVFYARALALHGSQRDGCPSIETMLATELSPVASSMFDDQGHMRATQKSHLKSELAIERSHRNVAKDSYFLDGCAILWVVAWPSASNAVVQDYIDAFRAHVRTYQERADVFLTFDRYINGSTKDVTRSARDKGATKVFQMKTTSRLPAAKLLFSVTSNKIQVIDYIIADLIDHKDDEVTHSLIVTGPESVPYELPGGVVIRRADLETTQEEADTIILQQVK